MFFPQESDETNTVLIINGLANWIAALFTCVINCYSQLFRVFFPLEWEVVDVCLGSSLVWIYEEYAQIFSEHCRSTAGSSLDEKILVWTSCGCSLQGNLLFCLLLRNHRNPGSLREPCSLQWPCAIPKQEEVAVARGLLWYSLLNCALEQAQGTSCGKIRV